MRSLFTARTWVRSANAWEIARVNIGQILKIQMTASPPITQKRQNSLPHRKSKRFPVLTVFPIISDFKAHFIFHVRNTNPLALSVHAVNYASHIKRGFISSAFIYPIIYHKALLSKGNTYLLTEDRPRRGGWATWNPVQNSSLKLTIFSWNGSRKEKHKTHQLSWGAGGGGEELANLRKIKLHNLLYFRPLHPPNPHLCLSCKRTP